MSTIFRPLALTAVATACVMCSQAFAANQNAASFSSASNEVQDTLYSYQTGLINPDAGQGTVVGTFEDGSEVTSNTVHGGVQSVSGDKFVFYKKNNVLLEAETTATNGEKGAATESTARIGAYSGAAHSALLASNATAEVVSGRLGMGVRFNNIAQADNEKGLGVWLAPVYSSFESDGVEASSLSYGVDLDFFGAALGADYTMDNDIRFGALVNFGSGDATGQQAAKNASTDFSYYGLSVYGGYSFKDFSVAVDLGYTVADNDVEVKTSYNNVGTIKGNTDVSVITAGATAQYVMQFGRDYEFTPHIGARYNRLKVDEFALTSAGGSVGKYESGTNNIISLPIGATFAREFNSNGWLFKPSVDFTLTANFGDTDVDSTLVWSNAYGVDTSTSTELIENIVYGATVGFSASSGNFATGLGFKYIRSSSTDEYGLLASLRLMF